MNAINKEAVSTLESVVFESFEEHLRVTFERDGISGVITLCERLVDAATQYGRGSGVASEEVLAKISGYFLREVDAELYSRK
ncbi:hypothetical protein [Burkholderia pseudomallei]|nr:hypothetical protein [Burkholderia pseudomallei]